MSNTILSNLSVEGTIFDENNEYLSNVKVKGFDISIHSFQQADSTFEMLNHGEAKSAALNTTLKITG